jgi:hypothetical protein
MAIGIKHDGVWHRVDLAGKMNTISFNIAPEDWIESADGKNFYFNYQIIGMLPSYSAIILFDFNQDGLNISAKCIADNLKFLVTKKPNAVLSGDIIYNNSGASAKVYFIGGMSDENINKATEKIASTLPIQRHEDGYTDIENFR